MVDELDGSESHFPPQLLITVRRPNGSFGATEVKLSGAVSVAGRRLDVEYLRGVSTTEAVLLQKIS